MTVLFTAYVAYGRGFAMFYGAGAGPDRRQGGPAHQGCGDWPCAHRPDDLRGPVPGGLHHADRRGGGRSASMGIIQYATGRFDLASTADSRRRACSTSSVGWIPGGSPARLRIQTTSRRSWCWCCHLALDRVFNGRLMCSSASTGAGASVLIGLALVLTYSRGGLIAAVVVVIAVTWFNVRDTGPSPCDGRSSRWQSPCIRLAVHPGRVYRPPVDDRGHPGTAGERRRRLGRRHLRDVSAR
jgi:hypothetical protein